MYFVSLLYFFKQKMFPSTNNNNLPVGTIKTNGKNWQRCFDRSSVTIKFNVENKFSDWKDSAECEVAD